MLAYRGYENISNVNGAHSAREGNVHHACYMLYRAVPTYTCVFSAHTIRPYIPALLNYTLAVEH